MPRPVRSRPTQDAPSRAPSALPRRWTLLAFAWILACATLPFLPALGAGFSDFDDVGFLLQVDGWRGLSFPHLAWMFTTSHLGHYQPLTYLSYAIEYTLFGLDPGVMHATNIALHALTACLLLLLTRRVLTLALGNRATPGAILLASAIAAGLWAVHPLRVENVAWITERRDVLCGVYLVGAALAYLRSARPGEPALASRTWYAACIALLTLSLFAKAWGITFVAVALLLDIRPLARLDARPWHWTRAQLPVLLQKVPFALLSLAFAFIAAWSQQTASAGTVRTLAEWGVAERLTQAAFGLHFYIRKTGMPVNLAALYELPARIDFSSGRYLVPLVAFVLVLVIAVRAWVRGRATGILVACAAYVVIISPVLGIFQSGIQLVADRYAYFAIMPPMILLGAWLAARVLTSASAKRWGTLTLIALAATLVLGVMSWRQATLWRSTLALWESAVLRGHDGPVLRNYYGRQLEKAGRYADALAQYEFSLAMRPDYADSHFGAGGSLRGLGRYAQAAEAFTRAAELDTDPTRSLVARGLIEAMHLNNLGAAVATFEQAVLETEQRGNPANTGRPYLLLASALGERGDEEAALRVLRKALEYPDTRDEARALLGN